MKKLKIAVAVVAGLVFVIVTHNGTDLLLEYFGIFTPPTVRFDATWMVVAAAIYRNLFLVAAGYLTAALSPEPKMRTVVVLGIIGTLFGMLGIIGNAVYDLAPMWYPVALVLLGFPSVYLGGKLRTRR